VNEVSSSDFWQSIYRQGTTGWDLGGATPVFCRLVESGTLPPGEMIVLGAGRGYDARLFARKGFKVTAIDFASDAVRDMQLLAEKDAPVSAVKADIFNLPSFFKGRFDYVLEYVCFCAIDPARREDYADTVAGLVKPGGHFVGLAYPIGDHDGGPPFAVGPEELPGLLTKRGFELLHREFPEDSIPHRQGREELLIFQKVAGKAGL